MQYGMFSYRSVKVVNDTVTVFMKFSVKRVYKKKYNIHILRRYYEL